MELPLVLFNIGPEISDIIDRGYSGLKCGKGKQVACCRNDIPPSPAEAVTRANLPEICAVCEEVTV
ncbi:hypothetical protein [Yersinia mollaretii]|uniref:hypothetical protein n=1 Tax=Yersinia mollaretii TaxID=33060 RepID=UPI0011A4D3DD|nr:hypothetical protein [Yersinia mollaretii]